MNVAEAAADTLLVVIAAVAVIVGAPLYLLVRAAVMLNNVSLGLPASYGLEKFSSLWYGSS